MRGSFVGVAGWQKNSFIDFPGTVSAVLFYSGCNLRCPYCHNPALVLGGNLPAFDPEDAWAFLRKRIGKVEGVVLSGGEPTLHQALPELVREMHVLGYRVKLDTNGLLPAAVKALTLDYLAVDIKTAPRLYAGLLGAPYHDAPRRLRETLDIVQSMGARAQIRITAAPGIVNRDTIEEIGRLVQGAAYVVVQPMQQRVMLLDPSFNEKAPLSKEELHSYRDILSEFVEHCTVRE